MTQSHHGGPEYHSTTTLNAIRKASPCEKGWLKLLKHLGKTKADDEPLDLLTVLDSRALTVCGTCATVITQVNRLAQDTTIKTCPVDFAQSTKRSNILDGFNSR